MNHWQQFPSGVVAAMTRNRQADHDGSTRSTVLHTTISEGFVGIPGLAHGGVIATILDETLGSVPYFVMGRPAATCVLSVRHLESIPVGTPLTVMARLIREDGRKLFVQGEIREADTTLVTAEAMFVTVSRLPVAGAVTQAVPSSSTPRLDGQIFPHPHGCYACGFLGVLHYRSGDEIVSTWTTRPDLHSAPGFVHGGILATVLEDSMGCVPRMLAETSAVSESFEIEYRRFARADGRMLTARSQLVEEHGTKLFVASTLCEGDVELASATAVFETRLALLR
jgi:acyl-coenzyme A thioesterase PaaI-like protein